MKPKNRILICLLACLLACAGLASFAAQAQSDDAAMSAAALDKGSRTGEAFVIYRNERGETVCRTATPSERRRIMQPEPGSGLHLIYAGAPRVASAPNGEKLSGPSAATTGTAALQPSAGLHIFLHGTQQLEQNPEAKQAFIVAANRWEAIISTPINVVIDVDFGTTFFGTPYGDPSILGQTGSSHVNSTLTAVRSRLLQNNPTASEQALYNALPTGASVPVEFGGTTTNVSSVTMTRPNARALGLSQQITNPDTASGDAGIGFNSAFQFDFTPDDGISIGKTDFDAVVTHEIGHALGFTSESGGDTASRVSIWDLFRFRPGAGGLSAVTSAARVMSAGGSQVFFNNQTNTFNTQELSLSTGGPTGDAGDGHQSSHWKDDAQVPGRPFIGIMDPTIPSHARQQITANDVAALDSFGYSIGGAAPPPPPPPAAPGNDNFVNAVVIQGAQGSVLSSNNGATREAGEPQHAGVPVGASVWYRWTAPASGQVTIDTIGSDFDTVLGVYTGSSVGLLTAVAANDDINTNGGIIASSVTFNAVGGTTYQIAVDGFDADTGSLLLHWNGPAGTPTPTPTPASFSVTGRVLDPSGNGIGGVRVAIDGPPLINTFPHLPVTTDAGGNFQFSLLTPGGNYTVRSDDSRFAFAPATATFNNISANQTVNFTATTAIISFTGRVLENGQGLSGVLVGLSLNGALIQQTGTDVSGSYTFGGVVGGQTYVVSFVKSGYTFNPPSVVLTATQPILGDVFAVKGNSIDASDFYVTQHYQDFLGRAPDSGGLAFWMNNIESCGLNLQCREVKRIDTSAAFFLSIEFQETGYLVHRVYKAAYGDLTEQSTGLVVPIIRREEFLPDTQSIGNGVQVGIGNWQQQLNANKDAYLLAFVQRQRFTDAYPSGMTPAQFVSKLNTNTGGALTQAEADALVNELALNNNATGRASVLRKVAENAELSRREFNRAFVLMQYYGYLRRNPNDAPDANFIGYNFWLGKLNQFGGDFRQAEMVKAFLSSTEYRRRFGQP